MGVTEHPPLGPGGALRRRDLIRLMAGAACGVANAAELAKLQPADEAARDPGLVALLEKVRSLTAHRDSAASRT